VSPEPPEDLPSRPKDPSNRSETAFEEFLWVFGRLRFLAPSARPQVLPLGDLRELQRDVLSALERSGLDEPGGRMLELLLEQLSGGEDPAEILAFGDACRGRGMLVGAVAAYRLANERFGGAAVARCAALATSALARLDVDYPTWTPFERLARVATIAQALSEAGELEQLEEFERRVRRLQGGSPLIP
jgi:hypothetical protein